MAITIKKIAELAGVSTGTVDRALHNRGRVDPKVAQRIKQIAAELDYRPNSVAKGLSIRNKRLKITVILHIESPNTYFDNVVEGINKSKEDIADFGISVNILLCPDFDAKAQLQLIDQAIGDGSHAIAIVPINSPLIQHRLNELHEEHFPVVLLTNIIEDTNYLSFVGCDYSLAGEIAGGLLNMISPKGGRLLLFSPNLQMYGHVLRANGLKHQLEKRYPHIHLQDTIEMTGDDIKDYQITKKILKAFPDTDLFVCPAAYSQGNLQAIEEMGYFEKSKIICYDYSNEVKAAIEKRHIAAAITQCPQQQGYTAIRILFEYLTTDKSPKYQNNYIRTRIVLEENLAELNMIRDQYMLSDK